MLRLVLAFLLTANSFAQDFPDGLVVVEFNASFNKANAVEWLPKLTDCEIQRVDIAADSPEIVPNAQPKVVLYLS